MRTRKHFPERILSTKASEDALDESESLAIRRNLRGISNALVRDCTSARIVICFVHAASVARSLNQICSSKWLTG